MPFSVAGIIRDQAAAGGDRPAIRFGDRAITYGELDRRASRVAQALLAAGTGPQDHVAFIDMNGPEYFDVLFGCAKINAINVGVNWRLAPAEMAYMINDAQANVLFVGPEFVAAIELVRDQLTTVRTIIPLGPAYEDWVAAGADTDPGVPSAADDVALQLYTSGTTGLPKGAMITNSNLETLITRILADWEFDAASVNLVASPLFNIAGGGWALVGMYCGAVTVLLRTATPAGLLQVIAAERVTNALLVPALLNLMNQVPGVAEIDLSSLRAIVYGASPISEPVLARSIETFGCHFIQAYALTEHTGSATIMRPEEHDLGNPGRLRSAGRPHTWIELRIADPLTGEDRPTGEVGEVWLRSGQVMKGYWNRPEDTAETITDGWLHTGDAGYLDAEGFLYLQDRVKDMIISGGQNVYPVEVENVLMAHPDVADVAVIGVPDERWGEAVKAVVVRRPDSDPDAAELIEFTRDRIAHFKAPSSIDFADSLPRNPSGKVLKRELREPYWAGMARRIN
ncbi:MAG: fatty acid--CoA ligase [Candidatus Dormibacteraceae bacterium]